MKRLIFSLLGPALAVMLGSSSAHAAVKVLLSVGEEGVSSATSTDDQAFRQKLCDGYLVPLAREAALRNLGADLAGADCLDSNDPALAGLISRGGEAGFVFHIGLLRLANGDYALEIHHWSRRDEDLPMYAHWTFE